MPLALVMKIKGLCDTRANIYTYKLNCNRCYIDRLIDYKDIFILGPKNKKQPIITSAGNPVSGCLLPPAQSMKLQYKKLCLQLPPPQP